MTRWPHGEAEIEELLSANQLQQITAARPPLLACWTRRTAQSNVTERQVVRQAMTTSFAWWIAQAQQRKRRCGMEFCRSDRAGVLRETKRSARSAPTATALSKLECDEVPGPSAACVLPCRDSG